MNAEKSWSDSDDPEAMIALLVASSSTVGEARESVADPGRVKTYRHKEPRLAVQLAEGTRRGLGTYLGVPVGRNLLAFHLPSRLRLSLEEYVKSKRPRPTLGSTCEAALEEFLGPRGGMLLGPRPSMTSVMVAALEGYLIREGFYDQLPPEAPTPSEEPAPASAG